MEPTVWHSRMMQDPHIGNMQGLAAKWFGREWDPPTHISPTTHEQLASLMSYARGEPLPREAFPEAVHVFDRKLFARIGELFTAGSYYAVRGGSAQVLSQSNLGRGRLISFPIYQEDKVTPVAGDFFIWEFATQKRAFLPEQSPKIRPDGIGLNIVKGRWRVASEVEDGDIAVSAASASEPPDVWCDPQLRGSLFFSDALVTAMRSAEVRIDYFHLRRCRLV